MRNVVIWPEKKSQPNLKIMYKYSSTFFFIAILLTSCVTTSNIPTNISSQIPDDANAIKLYSNGSSSNFYKTIYKSLAKRGFSISQENEEMGTLSTGFKDIDQGTTLKINVFVEKNDNGSVATLRGLWGLTSSMGAGLTAATGSSLGGTSAESANWGKTGRPKVAFGQLSVIANDIDHEKLKYISE